MMGSGRIVVGVDGSAVGLRAVAWAATEAHLRGVALEVVHVDWARGVAMETLAPGMLSYERSVLDEAIARARTVAPDVLVSGRLCEPPAGPALVATSDGAEMLVVGSRGLTGLKEVALGSVSIHCAHHATCPVVIIRPGATAGDRSVDASYSRAGSTG